MKALSEALVAPSRFAGPAAMQSDAVHTALVVFGITDDSDASYLAIEEGRVSALERINIKEDGVIEDDARTFPGFDLVSSDVTGRAIFRHKDEELEIITANRKELETCLGVDLIYVNRKHQNIVMLQYKMLEPEPKSGRRDWVYRPDDKLAQQLERMHALTREQGSPNEYRLNAEMFYLKFVKRDASLAKGGIVLPLAHYDALIRTGALVGVGGGMRVSFEALNGQYMWQTAFTDLIRCGYIGSNALETARLKAIIDAILDGNRAVVIAFQREKSRELRL
jgi:hypothetical protein